MKMKLRAVGAISFLSSSSIVRSLCFWRRSKWLQGILTLGRFSSFLCFPSSPLFVSAFFPLLFFCLFVYLPHVTALSLEKLLLSVFVRGLLFSSPVPFQSLWWRKVYSASFPFRNWVSFFALFVACILLVLDSVFLGSVLAPPALSLPLYFPRF